MSAKHTPGPWHVVGEQVRVQRNGFVIAEVPDALPDFVTSAVAAVKANARLIAAAPEMLEALNAIMDGFRGGEIRWAKPRKSDSEPYHRANTLMCAAIAKAEGREP